MENADKVLVFHNHLQNDPVNSKDAKAIKIASMCDEKSP